MKLEQPVTKHTNSIITTKVDGIVHGVFTSMPDGYLKLEIVDGVIIHLEAKNKL